MSEIMKLFENVGNNENQNKHKEVKNNIEKNHKKTEKQEKETKYIEKKKEIHKKIYTAGTEIKKNTLKNEIENTNSHFDKHVVKNMIELSKALDISTIGLERVIERESGFDKYAKSPTGAKGIMQLTSAPLIDMADKANGVKNYMHLIKKIPDNSISFIKNKWVRIAFEKIKDGDEKTYRQNIGEITSRAKNDPYCNLLVGCLHLARLKEEANPENISEKKKVITNLKKVKTNGLDEVNQLLIAKNKSPISPKDIDDIIKKLHKNEEYYKNFVSYINYNGDNTKQAGIAHKYLYAVAIAKAKDSVA